MGFSKPDLAPAYNAIRQNLREIRSPYNDGFTGSYCKKDLYMLKCWLEEEYDRLPTYTGEDEWKQEQERNKIMQILKIE